jgi:hypothetical protein
MSPPSNTILSSDKNTVSPAGTVKLLTIKFAGSYDCPDFTKYIFTFTALAVSSVSVTAAVLHNAMVVIALAWETPPLFVGRPFCVLLNTNDGTVTEVDSINDRASPTILGAGFG